MKKNYLFGLIAIFIIFMHFEGFLKLFFDYSPLVHGLKYVFAAVFFIIWIINLKNYKYPPISYLILLFSIFVFIQFLNPLMWSKGGFLLSMLGLFYYLSFIPLFFIVYNTFDKKKIHFLMFLIIFLATLSALFSYFQFSLGVPNYLNFMPYSATDFVVSHAAAYGPIAFDLIPPFFWYLSGMIFCLYFYFLGKNRFFSFLLAINLFTAILLTGLRSGILLSFISLLIFFIFRINQTLEKRNIKKLLILFLVIVLVFSFIFANLNDYQINRYLDLKNPIHSYFEKRGFTWSNSLELVKTYPLGAGLRHAGIIPSSEFGVPPITLYAGDNYFNIVLSELGIFGLISLLLLFYFSIKEVLINYFGSKFFEERLKIATFFSLIMPMIILTIFGNPYGFLFWIFLGVLIKPLELENSSLDKNNKMVASSKIAFSVRALFRGSFFKKTLFNNFVYPIILAIKNSQISRLFLKVYSILVRSFSIKFFKRITD